MEQIAVVKQVLDNGMAKISVERETACGAAHSCSECAGCEKMMTNTHTVVTAFNDAKAGPGDIVKVRSENTTFFKTTAIVYILPLVLALVGYFLALGLAFSEGQQVFSAFVGLAVGLLIAIGWDRHMKKSNGLHFHIVEIKRACSGL